MRLIGLLPMLLAACAPAPSASPAGHAVILTPSALTGAQAEDVSGLRYDSLWIPTDSLVSAIERNLQPALAKALQRARVRERPASYWRQYVGVYRDGRPEVVINGFCEFNAAWRSRFVRVVDGGACYFRARADPRTGQLGALTLHPEA